MPTDLSVEIDTLRCAARDAAASPFLPAATKTAIVAVAETMALIVAELQTMQKQMAHHFHLPQTKGGV